MKRSIITKISYALFAAGLLASCQKETSTSTGWEYNNINNGGFEKADFEEQRTQLEERTSVVEQGLSRVGLRVAQLGTEEMIELLYKTFNPGEGASQSQPQQK